MSQTKTSLMGQCISEFIGTALLVFFGLGCVAAARIAGAQLGLWEISIIWGLGVALAVYLTAGTSGAHLNPAVTVAFWLFACFERKKVIPYIVAQMLGGFFAAAVVYFMYYNLFIDYEQVNGIVRGSQESLFTAGVFSTYPAAQISVIHAFFIEVIIAVILVGLILALTDDGNGVPRGPFHGRSCGRGARPFLFLPTAVAGHCGALPSVLCRSRNCRRSKPVRCGRVRKWRVTDLAEYGRD